jgi:hypothetical protein
MAKIDRLGWAAGISFRACGLRLGVRVNHPEILHQVIERLPPGWTPTASPYVEMLYSFLVGAGTGGQRTKMRRFNLVYFDAARLARTMDLEAALDALELGLDFFVSTQARQRVFVNAGVVAWEGKAILIPGKKNTGKTSLVAELVKSGATYYSDEYAVLDAKGRVHPYSKPLAIHSEAAGQTIRTPVVDLGGTAGTKPMPVGLVVASEYRKGSLWRARELSPGKAVLTLLANTVSARRHPEVALATLQRVVSGARVLESLRGEAKETAGAILHELSSR